MSHTVGVRGSNGRLAVARVSSAIDITGADVVVARDGDGTRRAYRPAGIAAKIESELEIVGAYRLGTGGTALRDLVDTAGNEQDRPPGHDWGALGLPEGLDTRVWPIGDADEHDYAVARASAGQRALENAPWLAVAPGDRVAVAGEERLVVGVDRRKRLLSLRGPAGATDDVAFDVIDGWKGER